MSSVIKTVLLLAFVAVLAGCGGGGGDGGAQGSSNWDEMVWDQDNWG